MNEKKPKFFVPSLKSFVTLCGCEELKWLDARTAEFFQGIISYDPSLPDNAQNRIFRKVLPLPIKSMYIGDDVDFEIDSEVECEEYELHNLYISGARFVAWRKVKDDLL
jgi:hypothetical protein